MDNKQKAKIIVATIRREVEYATNKYVNARAELAKNAEGSAFWEKEHDSLDFAYNPYNIDTSQKFVTQTYKEKAAREEVLKYTIEVFLDNLKED